MMLMKTTGLKTPLPMVPAGDAAGVIVELGAEIDPSRWPLGTAVTIYALALVVGGGVPTINFRTDFLRPAGGYRLQATATIQRATPWPHALSRAGAWSGAGPPWPSAGTGAGARATFSRSHWNTT
jgi:NADPH:quinone reductase-like Zn-dependent oxidoreductase